MGTPVWDSRNADRLDDAIRQLRNAYNDTTGKVQERIGEALTAAQDARFALESPVREHWLAARMEAARK